MGKKEIKREELDYILTDCSPVELSELFSYNNLYNYLLEKTNMATVNKIYDDLMQRRSNFIKCFESYWATKPLDFYTIKQDRTLRELSLLQPLSVVNLYFFVRIYGNAIIKELSNPVFSIRYHSKNNKLFYKGTDSNGNFQYYYKSTATKDVRKLVEQTGMFFNIVKYKQIIDFGSSSDWEKQCIKYNYLCKIDYKNCFPSIYSHSFNWLITSTVDDAKKISEKPSLYSELDRTLQNINGRITNGIAVGSEFSRMAAELLLQKIDKLVETDLAKKGYFSGKDYSAFRFVDDIYIFTKSKTIEESVLNSFDVIANKFKLSINPLKAAFTERPSAFSNYKIELEQLVSAINNLFEVSTKGDGPTEEYLIDAAYSKMNNLRQVFDVLVGEDDSKRKTFSAYALSTIINKLYSNNGKIKLFSSKCNNREKEELIALLFHIYCPFISFQGTQKIISILSFFSAEIDWQHFYGLQKCLNRYSNNFINSNVNDFINLFLILPTYNCFFPTIVEETLFKKMIEEDNPVNIATFLVYSRYNASFLNEVKRHVEKRISECTDFLFTKTSDILCFKEVWYILIFDKCPYIDASLCARIINCLNHIKTTNPRGVGSEFVQCKDLVLDFMINNDELLIDWNYSPKSIGSQIVYRTHYKTIFRKKWNKRLLSAS